MKDSLSKLTDQELVELQGQIGDPDYKDAVLAEERRRTSEKALREARRANYIAFAALLVAIASVAFSVLG